MNDYSMLKETAHELSYKFELSISLQQSPEDLLDALKNHVKGKVSEMLDRDFSGFLNILYRLDIDENKFRDILYKAPPEKVSLLLAELIIEREFQKAVFRRKYSGQQ